jgi:hypothetical protein
MITHCTDQKASPIAIENLLNRLKACPNVSTWVVPAGFSIWKAQKQPRMVQVVGDNSEINGRIKRTFMELGWSVLEREMS